MISQSIVFLLLMISIYLLGDFLNLKGMEYPILKILMELIGITLLLIVVLHKRELIDQNQKKIEDYFNKIRKMNYYKSLFIKIKK